MPYGREIKSTPQESICTQLPQAVNQALICCETKPFPPNKGLYIPDTSFTIAVENVNADALPLVFADTAEQFQIEQFQHQLGNNVFSGSTFIVSDADRSHNGALLLRFLIGTNNGP